MLKVNYVRYLETIQLMSVLAMAAEYLRDFNIGCLNMNNWIDTIY